MQKKSLKILAMHLQIKLAKDLVAKYLKEKMISQMN